MSSIDASPGQQKEAAPVTMKHPRWCDRSLCTVPAFRPSPDAPTEEWGRHRSADLSVEHQRPVGDTYLERDGDGDLTWLIADGVLLPLSVYRPLVWALVDEHAEMRRQRQARTLKGIRAQVMSELAAAKEARS